MGPVDPTTGNPFNPADELAPGTRKGISVEDVTGFMALARDKKKVGLKSETSILETFKKLADHVHPLALGNVNRSHSQIRLLARKLLGLPAQKLNDRQIGEIVDMLTEKLYSHLHAINRNEAKEILKEKVVFPSGDLESDMWKMLDDYSVAMKLRQRFNVMAYMEQNLQATIDVRGGFLESTSLSTIYLAQSKISLRASLPPNTTIQIQAAPSGQVNPIPLVPGYPPEIVVELIQEGWQDNGESV